MRFVVVAPLILVACVSIDPIAPFDASVIGDLDGGAPDSGLAATRDGGTLRDGSIHDAGVMTIDVPDPVHTAFAVSTDEALQRIVAAAATNNNGIGGVVLRVESRSQNALFVGLGGETYRRSGVAMTPDATFEIASVSKAFTSVATLLLVDDGVLSLDDPIGNLLPSSVTDDLLVLNGTNHGPQITVGQLLSHRSGLPHYWDDPPFVSGQDNAFIVAFFDDPTRRWTPETILPFVKALTPAGPPGAQFHYADGGYLLLGMIIEAVSRMSLHAFYRARIFEPLGLMSATLSYREPRASGFVPSHLYWDTDDMFDVEAMSADWAGGGLIMNARDLARFLFAVVGGYLLEPPTLDLLRSWLPTKDEGILYGLGIYRVDYTQFAGYEQLGEVYGHDGYGGAFMYYWPREDLVVSGTLNHAEEDCFDQLIEPALFELVAD